ncbi:MAG: Type IIS restriction enzyme Eco57I [Verrucomicrobiae bacterium]|nr:Type IIS restriction enzyme Eco57I [Verrucomicrobiae bacterium]
MTNPATFANFQRELGRLVESFEKNFAHFTSPAYDEATLRRQFLDPFFAALGYDMENRAGLIADKCEVEIESRTDSGRADYLFRPGRKPRFVCEAKRPAEELPPYAQQAKSYAWTIGVPLAVLTDFEELNIYIVGSVPKETEPLVGLWKTYAFRDYLAKARDLWDLLARDNVAGGSIDRLIESLPKKPLRLAKGQFVIRPDPTQNFDAKLLNFLDGERRALASDLIRHNDRADLLEGTRLNEAVQCILDRLLFIRISEARGIDMGTKLESLLLTWRRRVGQVHEPPAHWGVSGLTAPRGSLWYSIVRHIRALDRRPPSYVPYFNGNLFKLHFSEELLVGDDWLSQFLESICNKYSAYKFGYVPVEILGTIYERFLGKIVRPQGRGAVIEEKPEVRKAGGVYYTPRYIVDYIVEQTVGKLLEGKKPEETLQLRFVDPACGSGSFLIRVFERVCEHWQQWLADNPGKRKKEWCWISPATNTLHLTVRAKRQILRETIYGVDIDPQAVEVTQLSLYLKMLEGETSETLEREQDLFGGDEAILPPLHDNIKCGNSLVGHDFSIIPDDLVRVNAKDWDVQFAPIMKAGGFDAVVGNPPWGADLEVPIRKYLSEKFARVVGRMVDSYIYFTDHALRIVQKEGRVGVVIPSTVLNQVDAQPLRKLLLESGLTAVVNLGKDVFTKKVLNTTTLIVTAGGRQPPRLFLGDLSAVPLEARSDALASVRTTNSNEWVKQVSADATTTFFANSDTRTALLLRLKSEYEPLGGYTEAGIARGVSPDITEAHVLRDRAPVLKQIEKAVLRRSISGKRIKRYGDVVPDQWIVYTHKGYSPRDIPRAIDRLQEFRSQNTCKEVLEGKHPWWALHRARDPEIFQSPKLIGLTTTKSIEIIFDEEKDLVVTDAMYVFRLKPQFNTKAALGVLHSKLFLFLYRVSNQGESRVIPQIKAAKLEPLPFPDLSKSADKARHDKLVALVDKMLVLMPKLRAATADAERATLQNAVTATDRQIDQLVYELYGLTAEEIALVESATERKE